MGIAVVFSYRFPVLEVRLDFGSLTEQQNAPFKRNEQMKCVLMRRRVILEQDETKI